MAFRIALSGLDAASTDLQVTGHNIANASTTGFKQSRAEFADIYANSINDVSSISAGRGVQVSRVAQQFTQGSIDFTSNNLDIGISGEGFFVMHDLDGTERYTRAGAFSVDREGHVVDHNLSRLQVFAPIGDGRFNTGTTVDLSLPVVSGPPSATSSVIAALNLNADQTEPSIPFDSTVNPPDPNSYNYSTATTIYDSLGNSHTMTYYFRRNPDDPAIITDDNTWSVYTYVDDHVVNDATSGTDAATLQFDSNGRLLSGVGSVNLNGEIALADITFTTGAAPISGLTVDFSDTTQYGTNFTVNNLTQDGFTSGRLSGIDIDNEGVVFARFTNGQSDELGKIAMARFNNNQGLRQVGDTSWAQTFASGDLQLGEAGTGGFGLMQSGALENSNVDIAEQLVNLITAQRNFQANAQVITTSDAITQTIINLR